MAFTSEYIDGAEIRTPITGLKVQGVNHYTTKLLVSLGEIIKLTHQIKHKMQGNITEGHVKYIGHNIFVLFSPFLVIWLVGTWFTERFERQGTNMMQNIF